eukprot:1147824-Amphidinium_carterae.1
MKKKQHRLLLLWKTGTHFRQVLVERTNLQHGPIKTNVVSTKCRYDVPSQRLQQLPPPSLASTSIMTQPQQTKLTTQAKISYDNDKRRITRPLHSHTTKTIKTTRSTYIHSGQRRTAQHLRNQRSDTGLPKPSNINSIQYLRRQLRNARTRHHHKEHSTTTYLKAIAFNGLYNYVDYTPDFASWYYTWYDEDNNDNKVYGLLQDDAPGQPAYADDIVGDASQQEANVPKGYKSSTRPTQQEIDEHNLTHLPYRDGCKHCVQGKNKSQHHQREGLTKQSITQVECGLLMHQKRQRQPQRNSPKNV